IKTSHLRFCKPAVSFPWLWGSVASSSLVLLCFLSLLQEKVGQGNMWNKQPISNKYGTWIPEDH
ncbi:hypothetical protein JRQ81_005271, partial [Phrynocephalus forsythii]